MSTLLTRSAPVSAKDLDSRNDSQGEPRPRRNRPLEWLRAHVATVAWLTPIVVVAGFVNSINLTASPGITSAERTLTMQAWAVGHLGQLSPYTYTYDHSPLGWLQIAAWTGLTDGFARYPVAVFAAREAMVAAALVSVVLLWFVTRRLGFGRAPAAVATLLFALSPLAIDVHRSILLANVATPWLLVALLLATSKRNQLVGFAGSAIAMGIAVLSSGTLLLAVPIVAVVMWRSAHADTRRYALSIAVASFVLTCAAYVMFALVRGQLFPATGQPSLIGSLVSQWGESVDGASSKARADAVGDALTVWRAIDPILFFVAPLSAIAGVFVRRIRVFAVTFIAAIALSWIVDVAFGADSFLSRQSVALLVPIAVVVIAGVVDHIARRAGATRIRPTIRIAAAVAVAAIAVSAVLIGWLPGFRDTLGGDHGQASVRQAERWVEGNVPKDSRLIVDNSMWVELVTAGFSANNVIWYPKLDSDARVKAQSPNGWKDSDYIVTTDAMTKATHAKSAESAIRSSVIVASFGDGGQQVQVRRIVPAGAGQLETDLTTAQTERSKLGNEISVNPAVSFRDSAIDALRAGRVDPRIPLVIGQLAASGRVTVTGFPALAHESGSPFREVAISDVDGQPLSVNGAITAEGRRVIASLTGPFAAQSSRAVGDGLVIRFPVVIPAGIIQ